MPKTAQMAKKWPKKCPKSREERPKLQPSKNGHRGANLWGTNMLVQDFGGPYAKQAKNLKMGGRDRKLSLHGKNLGTQFAYGEKGPTAWRGGGYVTPRARSALLFLKSLTCKKHTRAFGPTKGGLVTLLFQAHPALELLLLLVLLGAGFVSSTLGRGQEKRYKPDR